MIALLVVADDITGALDTGVRFARQGYRISVAPLDSFGIPSLGELGELDVLVIDTESRHLPPEEAAARVRKAVSLLRPVGAEVIYKKTDSTLRGNIGAELEALLSASGRRVAAYLPSFPDAGRLTIGGVLEVNGVPVSQSEFARDPLDPVTVSFIPDLLALQTRIPTRLATLSVPPTLPLQDDSIILFDAVDNTELEHLAELLRPERERAVFAGCAGFAAFLHHIVGPPLLARIERPRPLSKHRLIVCGSLNPRSLAQLDRAEQMGVPQYFLDSLESSRSSVEELREHVLKRGSVSLRTARSGSPRKADGLRVAERVGRTVAELANEVELDTLIVFGGDTLIAVMRELGLDGVVPVDEVLPGVPLSRPVGGTGTPLIVSKAGGFGDDEVLARIEKYLDRFGR